ncbi:MAG: threonine/serine exporter family protein [Ruthenibacterium sp.]
MEAITADRQRVMRLCMETGRMLLTDGGEIFRVQETMERMARAYGVGDFHVYVITNGLFASISAEGESSIGDVRYVPASRVHLGRLTAINALSRDIEAGGVSLDEALRRLDEIRSLPFLSAGRRILACGVGAACFSYLFGGTVADAAVALLAGLLMQCFANALEKHSVNKIIYNILTAGLVALISLVCTQICRVAGLPFALNMDKIIIGGIIPLVPGMALTTAIRDFAGGDYLSGTIRLIDALLVASAIAIGVGAVLVTAGRLPGVVL